MPAIRGFMVEEVLGFMGPQSLLHLGELSVRFCEVQLFFVLLLYFVVVSIVVLSPSMLCPVVRKWWAGADCT